MRQRLKIYAVIFSAFVAFDATRFLVLKEMGIIDWHSAVHAGWVVLAAALLLATAFSEYKFLKYLGLTVYLLIFVLALINQIFPFSDTLNYYCMLFNFSLFTIYYFITDW